MKIQPVASPHQIASTNTQVGQSSFQKAQEARSRAISLISGGNPQTPAPQAVVQSQNAVQPEEMVIPKPQVIQEDTQEAQQSSSDAVVEDTTPEVIAEPEVKAEDPVRSRQFAELARQEKALRIKQQRADQALKAKEEALAAKEAELAKLEAQYKTGYIQKDYLKSNPLRALTDAEVSYDELTQQLLNSSQPMDPRYEAHIAKLEAKIQALESKTEEFSTKAQEHQQNQYQAAIKQITTDVEKLVNSDPNYEAVKATGSKQDVVDLIVKTFNEDGILLSVEEAADEIENYILERAVKLSQLSKVQKRTQSVAPKAPSPKPEATQTTQPKVPPTPQPMKTLTNATASTRPLSARERAVLAFKGELK